MITYHQSLKQTARAMASARISGVSSLLDPRDSVDRVKMFIEGNYEKRIEKLLSQAALLEDVVEYLEDRVIAYVQELPLAAYDTGCTDGDRFLQWLATCGDLTDEQMDHLVCQRARLQLEDIARANRLGHVRFQELWSLKDKLLPQFNATSSLIVHVNPIRCRTVFRTTALLDEEDITPANVVVFACRNNMRTAVIEAEGIAICETLQSSPLAISQLIEVSPQLAAEDIVDVVQESVEMGLMALG